MELKRDIWTKADGEEFLKYLESFLREEKVEWTRRIINTKMPLLAIDSPTLKKIAKEISCGNYMRFLELKLNKYYENTIINGSLIGKIKDLDERFRYLELQGKIADNWATCDALTFDVKKYNAEKWYLFSQKMLKKEDTFSRRIGVDILFKLITVDGYIDKIFDVLDSLTSETEYYVNMAAAWLLAECVTKQRDRTVEYLERNKTNDFIVNKGVQKCRDSFRVASEDKEMLLKYKRRAK